MNRRGTESERGSALLITMIVITVVGTIAFAVGASSITGFRQQTQLEDSQNAYAAATAGLEDGLLRWRFDKNTETPHVRGSTGQSFEDKSSDFACANAIRPTPSSVYYDRVDLTAGTVAYCMDPDHTSAPDPTHIVYDLKIQYKLDPGQTEKVETTTVGGQSIPALAKDAVVEYDIRTITQASQSIQELLQPEASFPNATDLFEVSQLDENSNVIDKATYKFRDIIQMKSVPQDLGLRATAQKIRFTYLGQNVSQYKLIPPPASAQSTGTLSLDSRITTVQTIGYFGSSKRKLHIELDRESGKLLSLFDYALLSGQSGITP